MDSSRSNPSLLTLRQRGACGTSPCRKQEADFAAGLPKRQHITLSAPNLLSSLCCCVPGVFLFSMILVVVGTGAFAPDAFYTITALLTAFTMVYSANLSLGCIIGAGRMRRDCNKDWQSLLRGLQTRCPDGSADVMHIVILPNYQENEAMLLETLENLGRAPLAQDSMYVVLAMEEREEGGRLKAARLISQSSHLFAGIVDTYHPEKISGELAGKSSNCQWAYSRALRHFASDIAKLPASRVFLTVGDADTLWHPQFFSAMSFQALQLPEHEREWSFWQPPVLLMRNLFSVPQLTRCSAYGTILFELAGVVNTWLSDHCCYSAYSLTLAMASHPMVGGWDTDVIAEDHHMFCKCYFSALWEQVEGKKQDACSDETAAMTVRPKVQLRPVYLPAISYLVEDDKGWWSSCYARFQQARRHSQGIAELSYIWLQHAKLALAAGAGGLPWRTHAAAMGIALKLFTVHVINQVQAFSLIVAPFVLAGSLVPWVMSGGLSHIMEADFDVMSQSAFGFLHSRLLRCVFGVVVTPGLLIMSGTTFYVVRDVVEGHYTQVVRVSDKTSCKETSACSSVAPYIQGAALAEKGSLTTRLSVWHQIKLWALITSDFFASGETALLAYGLVPVCLAAWSLMRHGPRFEYIVAAKPTVIS